MTKPTQMTIIFQNLGGGLDNGYKIFELFFYKIDCFMYYVNFFRNYIIKNLDACLN